MPIRDILITLTVFGSIPFILAQPHIGILMWCWLGFMNPHLLAWGFSRTFPFAMIVALATLISFLKSSEPKHFPRSPVAVALLVFVLWMVVTTFFSDRPGLALLQLDKVWKIQLMIFVTMMIMGTKERLHLLIWVIVLSLGFYGVKGGIFTILTGGQYKVWGPGNSFIGGNNEIGLALIMTIPLMRYLRQTLSNQLLRHGFTAAMIFTGIAILGTHSRGAYVGLGLMLAILWMKGRGKIIFAILLAIIIPLGLSFMPPEWHKRMGTIEHYEQDASAQGRFAAWRFAYYTALKSPIVGGGFEVFRGRSKDAHSIYFEALGEQGFVGLGLFLLLMSLTWRRAGRLKRAFWRDPEMKWVADLSAMTQVSIFGYAASGAFLGLAYFDLYYNVVAFVVLCETIVAKQFEAFEALTIQGRATSLDQNGSPGSALILRKSN